MVWADLPEHAEGLARRLGARGFAIELNRDIMGKYRDQMRKFYFDPTKYKTYMEQLGITYPTIKK